MSTLVLPQNGSFREPFPPTRFKYEAESRERYNVRPEKKGKNVYWHMKKMINGRRYHQYVAKEGSLSQVLLENCAQLIEYQSERNGGQS